jgi:hypothetical protein
MKALLIPFFVICMISCTKKDDNPIKVTNLDQLTGIWKWDYTCGGFAGGCRYPSDLFFMEIEFTQNGEFIEKHNNKIYQQTNFTIIKKDDILGKLVLANSNYQSTIYIANYHLKIMDGDLVSTYTKIKE